MAGPPPWLESFIDKTIQMVQNDMVKKKIQLLILEPFLQYVIELVFPYVMIICVIFGLMIVMMAGILGLLVFRLNSLPSIGAAAALATTVGA